jgi:hypothetical protein
LGYLVAGWPQSGTHRPARARRLPRRRRRVHRHGRLQGHTGHRAFSLARCHGKRPHWDQAFSTDGGKTWEINWRNYFTRTSAQATSLPRIGGDPPQARDWDFLVGQWRVRNRRLRRRFGGDKQWDEFDSTLVIGR